MPLVECGFTAQPETLVQYGPTMDVRVGFDPAFNPGSGSRPQLPEDSILALVDTGATISCIDTSLVARLNLRGRTTIRRDGRIQRKTDASCPDPSARSQFQSIRPVRCCRLTRRESAAHGPAWQDIPTPVSDGLRGSNWKCGHRKRICDRRTGVLVVKH